MTAWSDIGGVLTLHNVLPTAARNSTANGSAVDVRARRGVGALVLDSAAGTGTTPTLDVKIQDSDDGSTGWADVSGAAFAQVVAAASRQMIAFDVDACRGHIRAVSTIGGTTPSFTFSVNLVARTG